MYKCRRWWRQIIGKLWSLLLKQSDLKNANDDDDNKKKQRTVTKPKPNKSSVNTSVNSLYLKIVSAGWRSEFSSSLKCYTKTHGQREFGKMVRACFLALPFTTGRFHDCTVILKIKHFFPSPRPLAWFLIWGRLLKKYVSWLCSRFDFSASSWTWGKLTLKAQIKKLFTNKVCALFHYRSFHPNQSMF